MWQMKKEAAATSEKEEGASTASVVEDAGEGQDAAQGEGQDAGKGGETMEA
jgi:hypothetical protein